MYKVLYIKKVIFLNIYTFRNRSENKCEKSCSQTIELLFILCLEHIFCKFLIINWCYQLCHLFQVLYDMTEWCLRFSLELTRLDRWRFHFKRNSHHGQCLLETNRVVLI